MNFQSTVLLYSQIECFFRVYIYTESNPGKLLPQLYAFKIHFKY